MNIIAEQAKSQGRDYATAEDIVALIDKGEDITKLRLDALEILGNGGGVGCEDAKGFAFVAWLGA